MSITFDFIGDEFYGVQNGIAAQGFPWQYVTLVTVPLATAAFSLSSGRAIQVHAEFVGIDSNGAPLSVGAACVVAGTSITETGPGWNAYVGGFPVGVSQFSLNGSNDLLVQYLNQQNSGSPSHDISVRVTTRWVGA